MRTLIIYIMIGFITFSIHAQEECSLFTDNKQQLTQISKNSKSKYNFTALDKQINDDIKMGFPSVAILIIKNNLVVKQTVYGYKLKYDRETATPLSNPELLRCDTMFDLASNTKMYSVNYALMNLVYQNKLDINKHVSFYLPEYSGCDSNKQCRDDRRILNILTHTAGYAPSVKFYDPSIVGPDMYSQKKARTEWLINTKVPFISGITSLPNYSDIDFMLLGMVIEKISGKNLDNYLQTTIYKPLKLHNTMFNPLKQNISIDKCAATEIHGNTRNGAINFPNIRTKPIQCEVHDEKAYYSMEGVSGHAGLFSNLHDLAILLSLALNNGTCQQVKLWDKQVQSLFLTPTTKDSTFGLGWRLSGINHAYKIFGNYASNKAFGHTGWTGTLTLVDPKYNLIIILLTNKKHSQALSPTDFVGDHFATGKYYPIINLIYESLNIPSSK